MNPGMHYAADSFCATWDRPVLYLCTVAVLAGAGLLVNLVALWVSIFAVDGCDAKNPVYFKCTPAGWLTMLALPWLGLITAVVSSAGLGLKASGRGDSPWWFLLVGAAAHLLFLAATCAVMLPRQRAEGAPRTSGRKETGA